MSNSKISALTSATTPLAGTETLPIVQSSTTKQVSVANLTAGRAISASSATLSSLTSGRVTYATTSGLLTDSANLQFNGTTLGVAVTPNSTWSGYKAIQFGDNGSVANSGGTSLFGWNVYYDGSYKYLQTGQSSMMLISPSGAGGFAWYTAGSGSAGTAITFTQQMGLDSSGNATLNTGNLVQGTSGKGVVFGTGGIATKFQGTLDSAMVSTTPVTCSSTASSGGGVVYISGYNASGGNRFVALIGYRDTVVTSIYTSNNTGLTINFTATSNVLQIATTSGTIGCSSVSFTL